MMTILNILLGRKRVLVRENERAIALHLGKVYSILGPGEHILPNRRGTLEIQHNQLGDPIVRTQYEKAIFEKLPHVASKHWTRFQTGDQSVAVIERDGALYRVLGPSEKLVVWTDAGPWKETVFDLTEGLDVPQSWARRLTAARMTALVGLLVVPDNQIGLLFENGVLTKQLAPGSHAFWNARDDVELKLVDLKRTPLDVNGQEMLTKDRVTIRVNISAEYRVTDPAKAVSMVKSFEDMIYRALQFAFRREIGAMSLDQILESKVLVSAETGQKVREELAAIGVEICTIELKDVILPGEMREILNKVVAAEKQAQANVIRRREETNATRSLLNTAKVMAENPVMLRLMELEALEQIAGKVQHLTVHNGTVGLMNDLVKLRET